MSLESRKDAPGHFGIYFKDVLPFRKLKYPTVAFFRSVNELSDTYISLLDAGGGNGKRYISGLFYLSEKSGRQMSYTLNDLASESLEEFAIDVLPSLPDNIHCATHTMDLTQTWSYPDSSFDAVMMTWVLHWLESQHEFAIKEMIRVMKPNALGFIATLSPYDVLIKNQVFPKTVSLDELQKIFPEADEIAEGVSSLNKCPIWIVKLDSFIFRDLQKNPDIVIVEKHPLSSIGRKTLAGFNPSYITSLLESAGCTVILQHGSRNTDFPNGYIEGDRANTLLYYVFRKSK